MTDVTDTKQMAYIAAQAADARVNLSLIHIRRCRRRG